MESRDVPQLREGFRIMMAGNLSDATGLDGVVEVIKRTSVNPNIQWVFVGGGNREEWLRQRIDKEGLSKCCSVLGRFPLSVCPVFINRLM